MGFYIVGGFIVFDILTGVLSAMYKGEMNSTKLRQGLYHKCGEILTVFGAALLEYSMKYYDIGFEVPMLKAVIVYISASEMVSILENISSFSPTLKSLFKPFLEKLKTEDDKNE